MERIAFKGHSYAEMERWDREQQASMTPDERRAVAKALRDRVYGTNCPDLREFERSRDVDLPIIGLEDLLDAKRDAARPKDLDDLVHLLGRRPR